MKKNIFDMDSEIKKINREIRKAEAKNRRRASNFFLRKLRANIKQKGLVDEGNLIKGVGKSEYEHATLVGIGSPGFHALMLEFGSYKSGERMTKGKGSERKKPRSTGKLQGYGYFRETWAENKSKVINMLSEDYF